MVVKTVKVIWAVGRDSVKETRGIEGLRLDEGDGAMLSAFTETFRR